MDWWLIADMSGVLAMLWMILLVAAGLGLVIFVHELGHFIAAKACRVKCEKFYIGFDIPIRIGPLRLPTALCRFQWGETEYGVGILPLGGYVKMLGQDDNPAAQARERERITVHGNGAEQAADETPEAPAESDAASADADNGSHAEEAGPPELDPRSYPAKPVWQRMIIISAGVIMNLVSAVLFAAVAYPMGVSYTPCIIGGTAPGSPAWIAGLEPEDKILQIGRSGHPDQHMRFYKDLMPKVMLNGADQTMDLLIRRHDTGQQQWFRIRPQVSIRPMGKSAALGVRPPDTTKLSSDRPADAYRFDDASYDKLQGGDEIVAVDGVRLPRDEASGAVLSHHLEAILAQRMTEPLTLEVRRHREDKGRVSESPDETFEVTLPPSRMRVLGLVMRPGLIVGVRKGSPADEAGLRQGDRLLRLDGQDVGNPLTLAQRLLPLVGRRIEVTVQRAGAKQPVTVRLTPRAPTAHEDHFGPGSTVALESLGIAFPVENLVAAVEPNSPAAEAGLAAGDRIVQAQLVVADQEQRAKTEALFGRDFDEPMELSDALANWHHVHALLQRTLPGTALKLTYQRDGQQKTATLTPVYSDRWFHASRGLNWTALGGIRTAETWGEAFALAGRETKESLTQVLIVLKRLVTGKISPKNLGGPIMIAAAAGSEASKGVASLLIFLTFLSANLAVLNFLPIPALDGGHMVFLAAEGIRGKPVDERLQIALTWVGVLCLLSLMVLVFALDIDRFFL